MFVHLDCRYYRGDCPCKFHRPCEGCPDYESMGPRVLIIKLGALGDVLRTGCLLPGLARAPEPPFVTWLTRPEAAPLVERMPGVHRVLPFEAETLYFLQEEHFDTLICLDKEPAPCAAAMRINAENRLGIGLSRFGTVYPLNETCEDYFRLGLDNEEKFHRNLKSYPQLIYEALGMEYQRECYELTLTDEDRAQAAAHLKTLGVPDAVTLVGINPGAGKVFAHKAWREEGYVELIHELGQRRPSVGFLMLGGAADAVLIERIASAAWDGGDVKIFKGDTDNPLGTAAALVERCAVVVSGDTLVMHLAVALRRRSVAIFGPTCPQEIDLFNLGEKVITPIKCSPCYLRHCNKSPHCQDLISAKQICEAVERQLDAAAEGASVESNV